MKTNFVKKTIKISSAVFLTFFLLFVFVKAEHKQYQYDDSLTPKENYEKAGHAEDYEKLVDSMSDKNSSYDEKNAEVTKYIEGFVPDWLKEDINKTLEEKEYSTDAYVEKVQEVLQSERVYSDKDGGFEGSTDGEKFTYTLLQELPKEGEPLKTNVTLKEYLTWAFRFTLALAGFLAVMMIVIGGVEWIISGANESSRSDAKKRINNAISGLVLALVSYLVLYTINPSLVDFENNQFFKEKETTNSEE